MDGWMEGNGWGFACLCMVVGFFIYLVWSGGGQGEEMGGEQYGWIDRHLEV
jgi:hypothetical protein